MSIKAYPAESVSSESEADLLETQDWIASLESMFRHLGASRASRVFAALNARASLLGIAGDQLAYIPYRNTIPLDRQLTFPGDIAMEERLTAIIRWNALAMVMRANSKVPELGGHIASYASAAEIFEVGFNHFFRADTGRSDGDIVYFQPHSAPGVYARAYLEGRLTEAQLNHYRQEVGGEGLSSYPHPWLMPEFWQVPTGSMGIGPITAIYQARFLRYLEHRGLAATGGRRVWGIFGDGEMDEPESLAGLSLAARENLDNLTFIINCNLQRLDGPVRGNGQIIQELERLFIGAGWNVIKVLWGSEWDPLFAKDRNSALLRCFAATVDGKYQTLGARDGAYNLANFFGEDAEARELVSLMTDREVEELRRGGHDFQKLFSAFAAATARKDIPTVILAKTKKGFGMSSAGESRMTAHQAKKLDRDTLLAFRDRHHLPMRDEEIENLHFYRPAEDSPEIRYLKSRRMALGGFLPARGSHAAEVAVPPLESVGAFALGSDGKTMSSTMVAVRLLSNLLKDKSLGPRIVPIVADEARTFGMANLFRQVGIYSPSGQLYQPEDAGTMLYYNEARDGQLLEEGITEAGALSSWIAAATSYSTNGVRMLPFYIFYSMFGFQRVGDLIWAAADQRARGFLIGATAGRTTLSGEGLQHQDGSSLLLASTVPNCRVYDPAFGYEIAVIIDHGARAMMEGNTDEFYYITAMNESYPQPTMPKGVQKGIIKGLYRISGGATGHANGAVRLLGSGAILPKVIEAARLLKQDWSIDSEVWSVTSYAELERDARFVERQNRLSPLEEPIVSHVQKCLPGETPIVAATDYVRAYPQMIASYLSAPMTVLGTDGFGRSDTRSALRDFFEVDDRHIVQAAIAALAANGSVPRTMIVEAMKRYGITEASHPPWRC